MTICETPEDYKRMLKYNQLALLEKIQERVEKIPAHEHSYLEFADIMDCLDKFKKELE